MMIRKGVIGVLLLMLVALQFRLWVGEGSFAHVNGLQAKLDKAQVDNEVKKRRNDVLRAEIRDLKNGYDALEEKARSELGLIKEGETFFLLVEQDTP